MIDEDEEGVYEYFYQENPPPEVEMILPPLEDPDFPRQSIPDNMLDNPLQPAPPAHSPQSPPDLEPDPFGESVKAQPRPSQQGNRSAGNSSSGNAAARAMNPSGF